MHGLCCTMLYGLEGLNAVLQRMQDASYESACQQLNTTNGTYLIGYRSVTGLAAIRQCGVCGSHCPPARVNDSGLTPMLFPKQRDDARAYWPPAFYCQNPRRIGRYGIIVDSYLDPDEAEKRTRVVRPSCADFISKGQLSLGIIAASNPQDPLVCRICES